MEHFKVLPTDTRFKQLTEDQIELLYLSFLKAPTDDALRTYYYNKKEEQERAQSVPEEVLKKMGYNKEDVEKIKSEL